AFQLQGETSVHGHLRWQEHTFVPFPAIVEQFRIIDIFCKGSHLHDPTSSMVIFRISLVNPVSMRGHPVQVLSKPLLDTFLIGGGKDTGFLESTRCEYNFNKMDGINDADTATGRSSCYRLRELQVWVHSCRWIQEPCSQML